MPDLNDVLPKETADKYEVVRPEAGGKIQNFGSFGTVDFSELTVEKADKLHKRGFSRLKKKTSSSSSGSSKSSSSSKKGKSKS